MFIFIEQYSSVCLCSVSHCRYQCTVLMLLPLYQWLWASFTIYPLSISRSIWDTRMRSRTWQSSTSVSTWRSSTRVSSGTSSPCPPRGEWKVALIDQSEFIWVYLKGCPFVSICSCQRMYTNKNWNKFWTSTFSGSPFLFFHSCLRYISLPGG